tara:strand:+ start:24 stop:641 length:618 start_codon:yes stop_codon:yes gene_type:complete
MKKVLLVLTMVALTFSMNAQKKKNTDTYSLETSFADTKKQFKANFKTKEIVFRDGNTFKVGDTIALGNSSGNNLERYQTIYSGKITLGKALLMGSQLPTLKAYTIIANNGSFFVIESITVNRSMGKVGCTFFLKDKDAKGLATRYLTAYSTSVQSGELLNPNAPLTRKEAISKLKESKDLFDLDMMSKEEYDAIKLELTPIIKNK